MIRPLADGIADLAADPPEPFDRLRFIDLLIGSSRGSRGACLWCGEVLTKADLRRDLCNACEALKDEATR